MAYGYLRDSYGIPNRIVVSERADHAWNLVKIGGVWYHVDVARDDPPWDNLGQALHSAFLIGTKSLLLMGPERGFRSCGKGNGRFRICVGCAF